MPGKRNESLVFPGFPRAASGYPDWIYCAKAAILGAGDDPVKTLQYLKDFDEPLNELAGLAVEDTDPLKKLDVLVFSCVVHTLTAADHDDHSMQPRSLKPKPILQEIKLKATFGAGRQALRIVDREVAATARSAKLAAREALDELVIRDNDVRGLIANVEYLAAESGAGDEEVIYQIKKKLKGIGAFAPTVAAFKALAGEDQTKVKLMDMLKVESTDVSAIEQFDVPRSTDGQMLLPFYERKEELKPCRQFQRDGTCSFGDQCKFVHDIRSSSVGHAGAGGKKQCEYCGKPGHFESECRKKKKEQGVESGGDKDATEQKVALARALLNLGGVKR
jgi:hypothetical protein